MVWSLAVAGVAASAERLDDSFEGREVSSRVTVSSSTAEVTRHRRESQGGVDGSGCERVIVRTRRLGTSVTWEQSIPASRVIDELAISVSTRSRSRGLQLAVRVVFPHQVDPRTGRGPFESTTTLATANGTSPLGVDGPAYTSAAKNTGGR